MPKAKKPKAKVPKARKPKKPSPVIRFFTALGGGVVKTGGGAKKAARHVGAVVTKRKVPEREDEVARRLEELKRLEKMREEERVEERRLREEKYFEKRKVVGRPLSERLGESFYASLKRPVQRMKGFFKGIDADLFRANMRIAPERYIALVFGIGLIASITAFILMSLILPFLIVLIITPLIFVFTLVVGRAHPKSKAKGRVVSINRAIPYALRHMATQLSSGIGLPETMTSVSRAGYGALSEEFARVIRDMHAGMSTGEALAAMDERVGSEPLRRAIRQIQRTLRTGGDLANILGTLADETAFELRMKLRDYTQSLNMLTMVYMFASAIIPAMLLILFLMTGAMPGAAGFPTPLLTVLYLLFIPFLLVWLVRMIKRMEPRV